MTIILENNLVPVQTVTPTISIGEIILSADRRSTTEKPLTDAERIRKAVLPAGHWGTYEATLNGEKSQSLTDVLREALVKMGSARLKDILEEEPSTKAVPLASFTVAELLKWNDETASSRGSITFTRLQAETWFDSSKTKPALLAKWAADGRKDAWIKAATEMTRNRFGALAAKNHGLKTVAEADKLLTLIVEADLETALATEIVGRIAHISKALAAKEAEETVSMGDL